jgi:hypothetical protein
MTGSVAGNCGDGFVCKSGTPNAAIGAMYAFPSAAQNGDFCPIGNFCSMAVPGGP